MNKLIALLALFSLSAQAGLPPTSSRGAADATNVTTFNYLFPGNPVTHAGVSATVLPPSTSLPNFIGQTTTWAPTNTADRDLEASVGNWLAFANTVPGPQPDNGMTGGTPSVTCTRSTTNPLDGSASLLITKGASNLQGNGCSVVFNVQPAYQGATVTITAALNISSGTIVQGDVQAFVYDVTNSKLITPFNNDVLANGVLTATFPTTARAGTPANQQYRLGVYFGSTSATAVTIQMDNFSVSPGQAVYGLAGGNLTAYTPTFSAGMGTPTFVEMFYRRVADGYHIEGKVTLGTVTGGVIQIGLPNNSTIDSTKLLNLRGVGKYERYITTASNVRQGAITAAGGQTYVTLGNDDFNVAASPGTNSTGTGAFNTGEAFSIYADVPIAGFDANVSMANSSTFKISSYLANGTRVTGVPNVLGQWRARYRASASSGTLSDATSAPTPTTTSGIAIWGNAPWGSAGSAAQPEVIDAYVGLNKNIQYNFYSTTGRTGAVDTTYFPFTTTEFGALKAYDPSTGVVTIDAAVISNVSNSSRYLGTSTASGGTGVASGYSDITVSENALSVGMQMPRSEVWLYTANGYGSTNTKIRRFTTTQRNTGTAISYADSATLGASFTINEDGIYDITYTDQLNTTGWVGISLNSTQLTTVIYSINAADRLDIGQNPSTSVPAKAHATLLLRAGDVVRPHTSGDASGTNPTYAEIFHITKVSN